MVYENGKQYLNVEEVARRFGINVTTVYRLAKQGELPGIKVGNQWRFSEGSLAAWAAGQEAAKQAPGNNKEAV